MTKKRSLYLFFLTLIIGLAYQFLPYSGLDQTVLDVVGSIWNVLLAGLAAFYLTKSDFLQQFKQLKFFALLWGIPLTFAVGIGFSTLYNLFIAQATTNSIGSVITIQMVVLQVPFMLMGEEVLSTNILIALQKRGLSFFWSSIICGILFALWHIPAYGFHPVQLLATLLPTRLALNYIWKKTGSIWNSWICHFVYDLIGFIGFFVK